MGRLKIGILGFAWALLCASPVYAVMEGTGDVTHEWGVGFNLSYSVPRGDDADPTMYEGAVISYGIAPNWVLQLDVGYLSFSEEAHGIDYGDLQGVPLILSVQWRHPYSIGTSPAAWYVLGGAGMVLWNLDSSDEPPLLGVEATADNSYALKFGGGFDVFFTDHVAWNVEASYTVSGEQIKLIEPGTDSSENQDTDFWLAGSGIRYYF